MEKLEELNLRKYSPEVLKDMTANFSETNLLGETQFGKVYRGKTQHGQDVTVKIWEEVGPFLPVGREKQCLQLKDECIFLMEPSIKHHPNLPKLLGYCWEDCLLGVVYDLKPLDTVYNLVRKDDFSWLQRMKVAIDLIHLIEFLHALDPPYLVRNIGSPHVMVDQGYNPVILDFGIMTGGVVGNRKIPNSMHVGLIGYTDPSVLTGIWLKKCDAFSFGTLLLELISKRVYERDKSASVYVWANEEYDKKKQEQEQVQEQKQEQKQEQEQEQQQQQKQKQKQKKKKWWRFSFGASKDRCGAGKDNSGAASEVKLSLVHSSLQEDLKYSEKDGYQVTKVALKCVVHFCLQETPKVFEVVQGLESLDAVHFLNEIGN